MCKYKRVVVNNSTVADTRVSNINQTDEMYMSCAPGPPLSGNDHTQKLGGITS